MMPAGLHPREVQGIMPRVVHFEFPADEPEKAAAFCRAVFG